MTTDWGSSAAGSSGGGGAGTSLEGHVADEGDGREGAVDVDEVRRHRDAPRALPRVDVERLADVLAPEGLHEAGAVARPGVDHLVDGPADDPTPLAPEPTERVVRLEQLAVRRAHHGDPYGARPKEGCHQRVHAARPRLVHARERSRPG